MSQMWLLVEAINENSMLTNAHPEHQHCKDIWHHVRSSIHKTTKSHPFAQKRDWRHRKKSYKCDLYLNTFNYWRQNDYIIAWRTVSPFLTAQNVPREREASPIHGRTKRWRSKLELTHGFDWSPTQHLTRYAWYDTGISGCSPSTRPETVRRLYEERCRQTGAEEHRTLITESDRLSTSVSQCSSRDRATFRRRHSILSRCLFPPLTTDVRRLDINIGIVNSQQLRRTSAASTILPPPSRLSVICALQFAARSLRPFRSFIFVGILQSSKRRPAGFPRQPARAAASRADFPRQRMVCVGHAIAARPQAAGAQMTDRQDAKRRVYWQHSERLAAFLQVNDLPPICQSCRNWTSVRATDVGNFTGLSVASRKTVPKFDGEDFLLEHARGQCACVYVTNVWHICHRSWRIPSSDLLLSLLATHACVN